MHPSSTRLAGKGEVQYLAPGLREQLDGFPFSPMEVLVQRIRRFGVAQTAKVLGVIYGLVGLVFAPIFILASVLSPGKPGISVGFALVLPIFYGFAGFVFSAIGAALYNLVATYVGGIEVQLEEPRAGG